MLYSLSEEAFEHDFIELFVKIKILLFISLNKINMNADALDITVQKYIDSLNLKEKRFDPFLIDNLQSLDLFFSKNLKNSGNGSAAQPDFIKTFYIVSIFYIIKLINILMSNLKNFDDLKIRLLKLKNNIINIEVKSEKEFHINLKSFFDKSDNIYIHFNPDIKNDEFNLDYIRSQLNFINNIIMKYFSEHGELTNILTLLKNIHTFFTESDNLYITFFYIFKYLKILGNVFVFIT